MGTHWRWEGFVILGVGVHSQTPSQNPFVTILPSGSFKSLASGPAPSLLLTNPFRCSPQAISSLEKSGHVPGRICLSCCPSGLVLRAVLMPQPSLPVRGQQIAQSHLQTAGHRGVSMRSQVCAERGVAAEREQVLGA